MKNVVDCWNDAQEHTARTLAKSGHLDLDDELLQMAVGWAMASATLSFVEDCAIHGVPGGRELLAQIQEHKEHFLKDA